MQSHSTIIHRAPHAYTPAQIAGAERRRRDNHYRVVDDVAYIHITNRAGDVVAVAAIDAEDLPRVIAFGRWRQTVPRPTCPYAMASRRGKADGTQRSIYLHRFLMGDPEGEIVDHINGDTLDNRKINLRVGTYRDNNNNQVYHRTVPTLMAHLGALLSCQHDDPECPCKIMARQTLRRYEDYAKRQKAS